MFSGITGNVFVLGLVSLLTDVSSEMIYPLLPLFLTSVLGAGPTFLGVIEGVAESTAALLKLVSGIWSDRVRRRKRLVLAGYGLSSIARPLVAVATGPLAVLGIRFADRIGKGVRTSPRDALIADSVSSDLRGRAYGFHRSMDHAGALIGPLVATALLARWTHDLRLVFALAAIPGFLAVLLIVFKVREAVTAESFLRGNGSFLRYVPRGPMRRYLLILLLFTLGNSTDAFLLLRAGNLGVAAARIPLLWALFHVVKMSSVLPLGSLSDRVGRRGMILAGWGVYALAYLGFGQATAEWQVWALFGFYGLFYGFTEGTEKALFADFATPGQRGAAFGWYHCALGVGALPASLIFGGLWEHFGATAAFGLGAGLAGLAAVLLWLLVPAPKGAADDPW